MRPDALALVLVTAVVSTQATANCEAWCSALNCSNAACADCQPCLPQAGWFVSQSKTWVEARDWCANFGATLPVILNAAQNKYWRDMANNALCNDCLWLAATDLEVEDTWRWTTNGVEIEQDGPENNAYDNWAPANPNNAQGLQHCLRMMSNGKWDDVTCESNRCPFVCQTSYEPAAPPEPPSAPPSAPPVPPSMPPPMLFSAEMTLVVPMTVDEFLHNQTTNRTGTEVLTDMGTTVAALLSVPTERIVAIRVIAGSLTIIIEVSAGDEAEAENMKAQMEAAVPNATAASSLFNVPISTVSVVIKLPSPPIAPPPSPPPPSPLFPPPVDTTGPLLIGIGVGLVLVAGVGIAWYMHVRKLRKQLKARASWGQIKKTK